MSPSERALHAYHDGELGWWARWRIERQLGRSPELREELDSLCSLRELTREVESEAAARSGIDVWPGIEGQLAAIDAGRAGEAAAPDFVPPRATSGESPLAWSWIAWRPVGAATLAAAGVALALLLAPGTGPVVAPEVVASGTVRYLDTGGRSVWVSEQEDVTIIWVLGSADDV